MRLSLVVLFFAAQSACAQGFSGVWRTYGDSGAQAESHVRIEETDGVLTGTVIQVFAPPAQSPNPRCEACAGELKDKPVVGMKILSARRSGETRAEGEILDPDEGRVYRATFTLQDGGARLEVRGYVGVPFFGRSQLWQRVN